MASIKELDHRQKMFLELCASHGLPAPTPEHRFCERKWKFDFAWIPQRVCLEIEGGAYSGGRHTRGKGFIDDIEKYNIATLFGWRLFRATPQQVQSGEIMVVLKEVLEIREE